MKFSIVITCYNNSLFLPLCLDSALRNIANKDGEIVCVDDYSTDETLSVLEEYAKNNRSIKIVRQASNKGVNEARRDGVLTASGDYVLFMDPDDKLVDGVIDAVEKKLAETAVDVLFFDFKFTDGFDLDGCDADDPKARYYKAIQKGHLLATDKDSALKAIYTAPHRFGVMVWGRAWRRELLLKAFSLIPEGWSLVGEDDCESLMFLVLAETVSMIDRIGYEYRFTSGVTNEGMNQKTAIRDLRSALFMTRFVDAFLSHFGVDHPYNAYLSHIRRVIKNKYGEIAEYLLKAGANSAERMERLSSFDSSSLMWTMFLCEREAEWARRFEAIGSLRFLDLLMKMKRVWLKIRMTVTNNCETKNRLKSEREALKRVRCYLRESLK